MFSLKSLPEKGQVNYTKMGGKKPKNTGFISHRISDKKKIPVSANRLILNQA